VSTPRILGDANFWNLVDAFFRAYKEFEPIFDTYENRVYTHAQEQGIDRRYLRLEAEEVSGLLDFNELEALRDGSLFEFKAMTHACLRDLSLRNRDKLDRYANELFHNVSILKEVQFGISTFAPQYDRQTEASEYESMLREVHEEFPLLVHRLKALFVKARERLDGMLVNYRNNKIFLRSLYLYGDDLFDELNCYPQGLDDIYDLVYEHGAIEGYVEAAKSFHAAGFLNHVNEAGKKAVRAFDCMVARFKETGDQIEMVVFEHYIEELRELLEKIGGVDSDSALNIAVQS
jgi:hypothetical protein